MLKIIGGAYWWYGGLRREQTGTKKPVPKDRLFYVQCVCRS